MEIRGERECQDCGTRFSYYETGDITCPSCGSIHSEGVGDRVEHTDTAEALDLTAARNRIDADPLAEVASAAASTASEYVRAAGFVHAGTLEPLADAYVAAVELRLAGEELARSMRVSEDEELYFLSLLGGVDDGERPAPRDVPASLRGVRGLAASRAVAAYQRDLRRVHEAPDAPLPTLLSALTARRKRIEALDGDVPPREADRLVEAMADVGRYLVADDETALVRAQETLDEDRL
jgi:uncharacterized Zn finger protein (UPF0148 family)